MSIETSRYTLDGDPALEAHLARTCARIARGLRGLLPARRLEAVLLGGGYGRGEGGVLRTAAGDRPYNDLEFYVFLRGNRHLNEQLHGRALHVLGEILTPQAGVEVEFKIASLAELARQPVSMFSYDLIAGHRWLHGSEEQLAACAPHRDASRIPLAEATRLLMNRCSGLLFALERLRRERFTPADADFVARNIAKAELALGDVVLVARGQYHWSARERSARLCAPQAAADLPRTAEVRRRHASGVEFKLHPERSTASREELELRHAAVSELARQVWLWLEAKRLGRNFTSVRDYAASDVAKWPDTNPARNLALNLRLLGLRGAASPRRLRHPRERIVHALALLLWDSDALADPAARALIQTALQADVRNFAGAVETYRCHWERVN